MSAESSGFVRQVSAVSPLGDALDGSQRPKPKRPRKASRDYDVNASRTFFCSNPQCDHATWAPGEQATHMAREFWEAVQAIIDLAPDSPQAFKYTGGVVLRELSDDDCRKHAADYARDRAQGRAPAIVTMLGMREFDRRRRYGLLTRKEGRTRWAPLSDFCRRGHELTSDNIVMVNDSRNPGEKQRTCRTCHLETQRARRRQRLIDDPAYLEQQRKWAREAQRRMQERLRADPVKMEAALARKRELARVRYQDPAYRAAYQAKQAAYRQRRKERDDASH